MKNYFLTLVLTLAFAGAHAVEPLPTAQAGSEANATGGAVYMAPISASPTITVSPLNDVSATNGPIANTATTGPSTATANPVATGTANSTATASPIVSPIISPTINGGNSSATGGSASLQNAGNATLNGAVSGTNTLNGNVTGTNTNNVRNDLTNQVGVSSNNANLNNIGVNATTGNNTNANTLTGGTQNQIDNSKTTNTLVGGTTNATGTANATTGNQVLHNITNVNASGGTGGKGGESSAVSNANSISKVENSGNSHSTSSVTNSGNSQSGSSSSSTGGSVDHVGNVSNAGNSSVVINNPKLLPPAPGVVVPNASAPTLFDQHGLPANVKGMDLVLRFMRACPSTYVKGVSLREVREKGESDFTNLIFTPHSNYAKYGNKGDVQMSQVVEIPTNAKVGEHRYLCLGLIQSEAIAKNAGEVPIQTIVGDAVRFTGDTLKGFNTINLVLIPKEALSWNMGLSADGKGFGFSPGASGMIGALLGTLSGGFTTNSGNTFPVAQLGGTFIVVAEGDFPDAAPHIDFAPAIPVVNIEQGKLDEMKSTQESAIAEAAALREALRQAEAAQNIAEVKVAMTEEVAALREALNQAEAARLIAEAKVATQAQAVKVKKAKKAPAKTRCKPCKTK